MGWKLRLKLNELGLKKCSDLWPLSLGYLQKGLGLGEKTGQSLWEACRGIDKRPVQVTSRCCGRTARYVAIYRLGACPYSVCRGREAPVRLHQRRGAYKVLSRVFVSHSATPELLTLEIAVLASIVWFARLGSTGPQEHRGGSELRDPLRHAGPGERVHIEARGGAEQQDARRGGGRPSPHHQAPQAARRESPASCAPRLMLENP